MPYELEGIRFDVGGGELLFFHVATMDWRQKPVLPLEFAVDPWHPNGGTCAQCAVCKFNRSSQNGMAISQNGMAIISKFANMYLEGDDILEGWEKGQSLTQK